MEGNVNHESIEAYSKSFAEQLINAFFKDRTSIIGAEILEFSHIKQINFFILKILFEKWQSEFENLKSPYFDFQNEAVKKAAGTFMNVLSKNILISQEDFKPILEKAIYKTVLIIFSPYEYYLQEINKPTFQKISLDDLKDIRKYMKINGNLLEAYIDRFEKEGIQAVFNDDAVRIFDEVCETIKETPEEFEIYIQELSKALTVDLNVIYSDSNEIAQVYEEDDQLEESDNINEKFGSNQQTLLDTLETEKKEAIIDIHEKKPLEDLKKSITINQRFMFENDLFHGDKDEFEMVINYLDNCANKQEAMSFIEENYVQKKNWDLEKEEVMGFFNIINKYFPG